MKNFLPTIFTTAAIAIVQTQVSLSQTIDNVAAIAEQVTVQIEPTLGDTGSGVIIGKNGNNYYVLTARHVLDSTEPGEEAYVYTYDDKSHQVDTTKIEKLPNNVDLLLLQFKSNQDYPAATISEFNYRLYRTNDYENSLSIDNSSKQYIFVSGWPLAVEKQVFTPGYLFDNSGTAISHQPDVSNIQDNFGGYELIYTNLTHPGMSGGPVLDPKGRLIGIHGRADGRKIGKEDEIIRDYLDEVGSPVRIKVGLSLGIPIKTFLSWASTRTVYGYLNVENSAPPSLSKAVANWQPPIAIQDTNNPYHWLEKGNQLWRIDRVAEARGAFNNAIALREDLYLAWFAKGFALGFDEKYDLALKACDKAIELQVNPSRYKYDAYRCKAGALQALQRFEPALNSLNKAININPNNPADFLIQGELLYALGQYRGALESLNKAVELRKIQNLPASALLYNNRGFVQLELRQYELALEDIETAIRIDPSYTPAWRNKGLVLEEVGRDEEALDAYDRATELDYNDYIIWTNKAFVFYKLKRYEEAKISLETALEINPDYQPAMNSLEALMLEIQQ